MGMPAPSPGGHVMMGRDDNRHGTGVAAGPQNVLGVDEAWTDGSRLWGCGALFDTRKNHTPDLARRKRKSLVLFEYLTCSSKQD
jgi:hypothetical protein